MTGAAACTFCWGYVEARRTRSRVNHDWGNILWLSVAHLSAASELCEGRCHSFVLWLCLSACSYVIDLVRETMWSVCVRVCAWVFMWPWVGQMTEVKADFLKGPEPQSRTWPHILHSVRLLFPRLVLFQTSICSLHQSLCSCQRVLSTTLSMSPTISPISLCEDELMNSFFCGTFLHFRFEPLNKAYIAYKSTYFISISAVYLNQ